MGRESLGLHTSLLLWMRTQIIISSAVHLWMPPYLCHALLIEMFLCGMCSNQEGYDFDDAECKAAVKILDTNSDGYVHSLCLNAASVLAVAY